MNRQSLRQSLHVVPIIPIIALFLAFPTAVRAQDDAASPTVGLEQSSCVVCHSNPDWFGEEHVKEIVTNFAGGVHAAVDLGCTDCHGGNPDPALGQSIDEAMDPEFQPNPFIGVPTPQEVPSFCGRCHSDPSYMRRYQPDPRVDQRQEYLTSQHGRALFLRGDTKVATCIDCHGIHGILAPTDPQSPVHPTNVAQTCRRCHGEAEYMAGYTTEDGRPLPVDQYARWTRSVHAAAMYEKEDLTAPTCNDCHGNHGAAPPGIDSIAYVCGQCHGREAGLFRDSSKRTGFQGHEEYIEGLGPGACANCHEPDSPQGELEHFVRFSECNTCHGNHAVVRPSVAMLAPLPEIPCAFCHEPGGALATEGDGEMPEEPQRIRRHYEEVRDGLLAQAADQGLEGDGLFDWMVDQALSIEPHQLGRARATEEAEAVEEAEGNGGEPTSPAIHAGLTLPDTLRPEFRRLFEKFRIGQTYYTYEDPATGETVKASVRRCENCHAQEPTLADEAVGWNTSQTFLTSMRDLTSMTARAERIMLSAKRGGVLTEEASLAIDRAVDAQIQLEVLVHTFDASEDSQFVTQRKEGMDQARTALEKAQEALDELQFRRKGLAVSLVVILLVLLGLGLKIREMSG